MNRFAVAVRAEQTRKLAVDVQPGVLPVSLQESIRILRGARS